MKTHLSLGLVLLVQSSFSYAANPVILSASLSKEDLKLGDEFTLTLVAQSDLPVNWIQTSFQAPSGLLTHESGRVEFEESALGEWTYTHTFRVPEASQVGNYQFISVTVMNEANEASENYKNLPMTFHVTQAESDPSKAIEESPEMKTESEVNSPAQAEEASEFKPLEKALQNLKVPPSSPNPEPGKDAMDEERVGLRIKKPQSPHEVPGDQEERIGLTVRSRMLAPRIQIHPELLQVIRMQIDSNTPLEVRKLKKFKSGR